MCAVTWARLAICLCMLSAWSCGDDAPPPKLATRDAGDEYVCVDEDGDGYGTYCDKGNDCNDSDPKVTDECRRCKQPKFNCPCKPGTMPLKCDPPNIEVEGGTLVCSEGTRYCRDGLYSDCEIIGEYVLVPNK
jgi:hypothetical protein